MSSETICLTLGDWQWNAAIVGFINIVGEENVHYKGTDAIEFSAELLDGFADKYFAYFINTYEKMLSWYRIISFKDQIDTYEENNFDSFDLKDLESLNKYIEEVKKYLKSNSYQAAYELIEAKEDILSLEKQLTKIKKPKTQQQFEENKIKIMADIQQNFVILKRIIVYCSSSEVKRYIGAKNAIYSIINKAWDGVCFLFKQTKEKDMYVDYKKYFVDEAVGYLKSDKSKNKYQCFICDAPIKNMDNVLSFLNATGFDVMKKSSHVWDFQNDIALCPICKLVYSCLPAGIIYTYYKGLYVNVNVNLKKAVAINYKLKRDILQFQQGGGRSAYFSLVNTLNEQENDTAKYELADIQVVRYENESYRFNILSRRMLAIIAESKGQLNSLIRASFNENSMHVYVYDEVIARIFNSQNLFTLIHKMLHYKISDSSKCYFDGRQVSNLLIINQKLYKHLGGMKVDTTSEKGNMELVKNAKAAGYYLRQKYREKDADNKIPGICYRLLNALKTANSNMFMDVTLNCYLYVKSQVPKVIADTLGQGKAFSTMGYAFVAGLIDGQDTEGKSQRNFKEEKQ